MTIEFNLFRKKYIKEAVKTVVSFNGQSLDVIYPSEPLNGWGINIGWGNSPLFYPDQSPVLGRYKRATGQNVVFQVVIDTKTQKVVSQFVNGKQATFQLQEFVNTRKEPGTTLFK